MIGYDGIRGEIAVIPDTCPTCGEPRVDTGCDAPGCTGAAFPCCGLGCDNGLAPGDRCETAEREAFGDDQEVSDG